MAPEAESDIRSETSSGATPPLTSQMLAVGDGHELYVETIGNADGLPAVYLHGGPGSGCQPDHRRLFDAQRFHAVLFDQRGAGRSRPKGGRDANTLPHLIADMEVDPRPRSAFDRWLVVGGSWGATLALAYAEAHPRARQRHRAARDVSRHPRRTRRPRFCETLPRFYPGTERRFSRRAAGSERAAPLDAYWRRILDPDPAVHGPAARAWGETEVDPVADRAEANAARSGRAQRDRGHCRRRRSWKRITSATTASCGQISCSPERRCARRHPRPHRAGPLRSAVSAVDRACAVGGLAGRRTTHRRCRRTSAVRPRHPRCGDAGDQCDVAAKTRRDSERTVRRMPLAGTRNAADLDGHRSGGRAPISIDGTTASTSAERVAIDGFLEARRYVAHDAAPKYLGLYSTSTFDVLSSPAYRTALANQTEWSNRNIAQVQEHDPRRGADHREPRSGSRRRARAGPDSTRSRAPRTHCARRSSPSSIRCVRRPHFDASVGERSGAVEAADRPAGRHQPRRDDWFVLIDGTDVGGVKAAIDRPFRPHRGRKRRGAGLRPASTAAVGLGEERSRAAETEPSCYPSDHMHCDRHRARNRLALASVIHHSARSFGCHASWH